MHCYAIIFAVRILLLTRFDPRQASALTTRPPQPTMMMMMMVHGEKINQCAQCLYCNCFLLSRMLQSVMCAFLWHLAKVWNHYSTSIDYTIILQNFPHISGGLL